jgi:peptidoglycan/xylan/chitin deacetylase (PgdA/CDA1 family)
MINICFHGIGTPRRDLEPGEGTYWVSTDRFQHILDELAALCLTTLSPVRISFDDGNASDTEIALPALVERELRADFFVVAGRLGTAGSLDDDAVRELRHHGMGIGSHGMRHRSWRGMDPDTRYDELVAARERLTAAAGTEVDTAACPLGGYDRRVLAELRRLGYRRVYTSDRRPARRNAWLQPRYSVRGDDTAATVRDMVLSRPALPKRVRAFAVGLAKRWRGGARAHPAAPVSRPVP